MADTSGERRRYFRIDDNLALVVRRLNKTRFDEELIGFEERRESLCVSNSIEYEQEKLLPLRRSVEENFPEVAEYIAFLEKRIDALSLAIMADDEKALEPAQRVNISAQGIRFYSSGSFNTDDMVELQIRLKPSRKRLLIIGTVIWCLNDSNVSDDAHYAVAVDFSHINEADREVLVKHILKKQLEKPSAYPQEDV